MRVAVCHPPQRDRGFGLCAKCYLRDYRSKNITAIREKARNNYLRRKYGLTLQQRDAMLLKQGHKCALCFEALESAGPRTHVDHDHSSGRVRGILCNRCNWYMAKIDADQTLLDRLRAYAN